MAVFKKGVLIVMHYFPFYRGHIFNKLVDYSTVLSTDTVDETFPLITLAHRFGPKAKLILGPYLYTVSKYIEDETAALGGFFFLRGFSGAQFTTGLKSSAETHGFSRSLVNLHSFPRQFLHSVEVMCTML